MSCARRCARPYASSRPSQYVRIAFETSAIESRFEIGCRMRHTPGMTETDALERLAALEIETPSWGYGNSGTRFHVYPWPGAARDRARADRRRGARPPADRLLPARRAAHPLGRASTTTASCGATPSEQGVRIGAINPNLFGDDAYRLGSLCHPDAAVRARRSSTAASASRSRSEVGSTIDQPLARRRDELPRPGRPRASVTRGSPAGLEEVYALAARRDAPARRVQVLRARLLQHRSPRLGNGRAALPPSRPAGAGARRHRPPSAGDEHRADRRAAARRRAARRLPLQQPQVRRRRPDRRLDRPVRALPDHARDRARRRPPRTSPS